MKSLLLLPALLVAASMPVSAPVVTEQPLGEHDWVVDPGHSSVVFKVKHANASWFFGTFDKIEGKVTLDPDSPGTGSVELTIPVDSVDSNNERRDGHLRSPDFFAAKENPDITFRSTKIVKAGDDLSVTGELAMAGKKQTITMSVEMVGDSVARDKRRGYLATFTIKRSEFGMTYGNAKVLGDEITLMIALEMTQPK